jgi:CubicO group peptidase (beta-lactamase class C family)
MSVIRWLLNGIAAILLVALGAILLLITTMWVADPAVPRNIFFGQPISAPASVELSQPQALVAGVTQEVPSGHNTETNTDSDPSPDPAIDTAIDPELFDPLVFGEAVRYADESRSVALLVQQGGVIRYERYWPGYDVTTRTNPNSMHKPVLALLLGAAIADGYIGSVDDAAALWLPEWRGDARRDITLRHLLQMASGLEVPVFGTWKSAKILFGSDLVAGVIGLVAEKPAGSDFQYSNANSQLLALVIERATGRPYAEYLSQRLWQPLGAGDAFLWLDRPGGMPRGFCCLFATARDWLRVGELLLNRGAWGGEPLVPRDYVEAMLSPSATNPNFGFQLWLGSPKGQIRKYNDYTVTAFHSVPFVVEDVITVDGYGGQRVYIVPSRELIIVRTGVSRSDWDDAVIPNAVLRALRLNGLGVSTESERNMTVEGAIQ